MNNNNSRYDTNRQERNYGQSYIPATSDDWDAEIDEGNAQPR
jgi:hypothetical protein